MNNKEAMNMIIVGDELSGKCNVLAQLIYFYNKRDPISLQEYQLEHLSLNQGKNSLDKYNSLFKQGLKDNINSINSSYDQSTVNINFNSNNNNSRPNSHKLYSIESETKVINISDISANPNFIKNMITGISKVDVALFVISSVDNQEARQQHLKKHLTFIKNMRVKELIFITNKMDLIHYDQKIYNELVDSINKVIDSIPYLKSHTTIYFIPVCSYNGENVIQASTNLTWYNDKILIELLNEIKVNNQQPNEDLLRISIQDTIQLSSSEILCIGKIESGILTCGDTVIISPNNTKSKVDFIEFNNQRVNSVSQDNKVTFKLTDINHRSIRRGHLLSHPDKNPCLPVHSLLAYITVLSYFNKKDNEGIKEGFEVMIDSHNLHSNSCVFARLIKKINDQSDIKEVDELLPGDNALVELTFKEPIAIDCFYLVPSLGRIALRNASSTIAVGVVVKIVDSES
ncbi:P-loop containing nucleoside triphosphate hydrolase protein [Neoconidiobolus thromboides FSU 785]|nr:P-loop containing nucleoside triphosphate hydrolase protein [Neoconidiobolus thromboides FSU 785]